MSLSCEHTDHTKHKKEAMSSVVLSFYFFEIFIVVVKQLRG